MDRHRTYRRALRKPAPRLFSRRTVRLAPAGQCERPRITARRPHDKARRRAGVRPCEAVGPGGGDDLQDDSSRTEPATGALLGRVAPPRDHRDRLAGTTAYALEATAVLDIIQVAAATRRTVLVAGSSKGLSASGPRPDGSRPARGDTWLQLRRFLSRRGQPEP